MALKFGLPKLVRKGFDLPLGGDVSGGFGWGANSPWIIGDQFPSSRINYQVEAGDPLQNAIVMGALNWIIRTFPQAPLQVVQKGDDSSALVKEIPNHPFTLKMANPNPYYPGEIMWQALLISYHSDGNAYMLKVRDKFHRVDQFWYEPHYSIRPHWPSDGSKFIDGYQIMRRGHWITDYLLPPEDVVHFRYGIDPQNNRLGLSPLKSVLREIYTDNEAANYTATLLRNRGVPGLVISPKVAGMVIDDPQALKDQMIAKTTGDRRGEPLVMQGPTAVSQIGFSPNEINMDAVRNIPEERIAGVVGVPMILTGLGAHSSQSCLPAGARVQTVNRGPVLIEDVVVGDSVWSTDGDALVPGNVTWSGSTGRKVVYKLKAKNRTIRASGNHPFLVRRGDKVAPPFVNHRHSAEWRWWLEWAHLEDLRPGDAILGLRELPDLGGEELPDGTPATVELLEWIGAFLGDGSFTGGERYEGIQLCIPLEDRVRAHYEALTRSLFVSWQRQGQGRITNKRHGFSLSTKDAALWLSSLGSLKGARTKRIPGWVFGLQSEFRAALLRGLLDTDGTVNNRGHADFRLANEALVHDIRDLAVSLGMQVTNVYHRRHSADVLKSVVQKHGYKANREYYDYWHFTISSAEDVRRIGTNDPKYKAYLDACTEKKRCHKPNVCAYPGSRALLPPGCEFIKIQSIEREAEEEVYDLTVEETHNFISDLIIVSNSYNNMREAKASGWEENILPSHRVLSAILGSQALPDFGDPNTQMVVFDTRNIPALSEDLNAQYVRISGAYNSGWMKRKEALRLAQLPYDDKRDNVYKTDLPMITQRLEEMEQGDPLLEGIADDDDAGGDEPEDDDESISADKRRQMAIEMASAVDNAVAEAFAA